MSPLRASVPAFEQRRVPVPAYPLPLLTSARRPCVLQPSPRQADGVQQLALQHLARGQVGEVFGDADAAGGEAEEFGVLVGLAGAQDQPDRGRLKSSGRGISRRNSGVNRQQ